MARLQFDQIAPQADFETLPIAFTGTASRSAAISRLMLVVPAMAVLVVPVTLAIAHAAVESGSPIDALTERPFSAVQIAVGLIVWCALFLLPLRDIVMRLGSRRHVKIEGGKVSVADTSPFGTSSWAVPLASYSGIAHHVRASLSGLRHELILVHEDPSRNVLVAVADRIPQATLDRAKTLLGLPEVPAKTLYVRGA
jgi:hypothetical protein